MVTFSEVPTSDGPTVLGVVVPVLVHNSQHWWAENVGSCCVRVGSGVRTGASTPNIGGPTMLGVVVSVLVVVCKRMQQLPTTRSNKQQGVQTDATCKIQQCWELLANNVASDCRGALVVSYSYFSFDAVRSRNTIKSIKFCRMIDISLYYLNFFY